MSNQLILGILEGVLFSLGLTFTLGSAWHGPLDILLIVLGSCIMTGIDYFGSKFLNVPYGVGGEASTKTRALIWTLILTYFIFSHL